jgi:PKD repeat protein
MNTRELSTGAYRYGIVTANASATDVMQVRQPANLSIRPDIASTVVRGDRLTANLTLTNRGGLTWDGSVELRLDTDGDGRTGTNETVMRKPLLVDPGQTTTVELGARTDDLDVRSYRVEVNASENTVYRNVTVVAAPPNFTTSAFDHPARINRTDRLRASVDLENNGGIRGRPWLVELWLDRNDDGEFDESERLDDVRISPGRGIDQLVTLQANVSGLDERYYTVAVTAPNVTETARIPVGDPTPFPYGVPGVATDRPPTDVDDDQLVEDINGDGRFTFVDVIGLVFADYDTINRNDTMRPLLDFSGDGRVSFVDVIELVFQL